MQIYDFEAKEPPRVSEKMLREELERRRLRREILLLRIASAIFILCLVAFAVVIVRDSLLISILSVVFACLLTVGHGIVSILYFRRGEVL